VTPYVIEESCGTGTACEHARVREGYRFELRCPEKASHPPSFHDRWRACAPDAELKGEIVRAASREPRYEALMAGLRAVKAQEHIRGGDEDTERLTKSPEPMSAFAAKYGDEEAAPPDAPTLREALDTFTELARTIARVRVAEARGETPPKLAR